MSLDASKSKLTKIGTIKMKDGCVYVNGFEGENCSCRDVAVLALAWAIGELSREMALDIQEPGGSRNVCVN